MVEGQSSASSYVQLQTTETGVHWYQYSLGLLLGTEAPVIAPNGVDFFALLFFSFLFFSTSTVLSPGMQHFRNDHQQTHMLFA